MDEPFHLLPHFPKLDSVLYRVTSPSDAVYNCLAWAANDSANWWWPDEDSFWPEGLIRTYSLETFIAAYEANGFHVCDSARHEPGFERIAIYANDEGPQHAARQLPDGTWTSKLGPWEDIVHATLEAIECSTYGRAVKYLKRPIRT